MRRSQLAFFGLLFGPVLLCQIAFSAAADLGSNGGSTSLTASALSVGSMMASFALAITATGVKLQGSI
jgi:hypothetical protein